MLESEFGTQLFLRTTRTLKPTAEAHRIYDLARQIIGTFDMARSSVEEVAPRPTGTLRIGVPSSFGRRYMMPDHRRICPALSGGAGRHPLQRTASSIWWRKASSWRCGSETWKRARWSRAGSARCSVIWWRRRPICTAARCRGRRTISHHINASSIRGCRRRINGPSNPSTAVTSPRSTVRSMSTMPTRCRRRRCITSASRSCPTGMRRRACAAASSSTCCRTTISRHCRCTRSIRRRTGCRCARESFLDLLVERAEQFAPVARHGAGR